MRLIDADALTMLLHDNIDGLKEEFPNDKQVKPYICGVRMALSFIEIAPTVDAVPRWIPCEEGLPEPNVAVLGYAPAFDNIYAVYYDSVCGWMTWSPVYDNPFPSCQGEIVAWMPLPEPYKKERKDDE